MKAQEQLYEIQTEVKRKVATEEKLQLDPYFPVWTEHEHLNLNLILSLNLKVNYNLKQNLNLN